MKKVFKIDRSLKYYQDNWEEFYEDLEELSYSDILITLTGSSIDEVDFSSVITLHELAFIRSSTFNMLFSSFMLNLYPNSYQFKKYFSDLFKSDLHSYYIYQVMKDSHCDPQKPASYYNYILPFDHLFRYGKMIEKITIDDIKKFYGLIESQLIFLVILINEKEFDATNFEATLFAMKDEVIHDYSIGGNYIRKLINKRDYYSSS